MSKIIEFRNTNFGYDNLNCFNDFNMEIERKDIVTLVGPSGSGKTTLLKMLCHRLPNETIYYNGKSLKDYTKEELQKEIIVIFDEPFRTMTPKDELSFYLKKLNYSKMEIQNIVAAFLKHFKLSDIEDTPLANLGRQEKYLIKILRYLILSPKFVAIDNIFSNLNDESKKKVIAYIKKTEITLLNITTNLDDSLLGNKLFVMENFVLILEGKVLSVLKTDTLLKKLGFRIPLPIDLSIELNHYEVLNKIYTDKERLVNALWK